MAFQKHLRKLPLVGDRIRRRAVGAGDPHADVVDGKAVDDLKARALDRAFGVRHDVFGREAPFFDEALRDLGLSAHLRPRGRCDAHEFEQGVEAPLLSFGGDQLFEHRLHRGVVRDRGRRGFDRLGDVGDDAGGGGGGNAKGEARRGGQNRRADQLGFVLHKKSSGNPRLQMREE